MVNPDPVGAGHQNGRSGCDFDRSAFLGRYHYCAKAAFVCDVFGLGVSMHSGGELGISLAAMLQLAASLPNLAFPADAHYHHVVDDIIKGGKIKCENGDMTCRRSRFGCGAR
ncbi:MAG: enolase C-terminal domain-like protein [Calditrichia bacterium]